MHIHNTRPSLITLPPVGKVKGKLSPGPNEVDSKYWDELKKRMAKGKAPGLKMLLDLGVLRELKGEDRPPKPATADLHSQKQPDPKPQFLRVMQEDEALTLIQSETDKEQLITWGQNETRPEVVTQIVARLQALGVVVNDEE